MTGVRPDITLLSGTAAPPQRSTAQWSRTVLCCCVCGWAEVVCSSSSLAGGGTSLSPSHSWASHSHSSQSWASQQQPASYWLISRRQLSTDSIGKVGLSKGLLQRQNSPAVTANQINTRVLVCRNLTKMEVRRISEFQKCCATPVWTCTCFYPYFL